MRFSRSWKLAGLPLLLVGMVAGLVMWGGFNTVLEVTNRTEFCISCHEMRENVYVEYQKSVHFQNASGVRAECADCHVPRDWPHKVLRKVKASAELWHWALGSIDTREKFEEKRHTLARQEWRRMRASDSRECRNCHSFAAMDFHKQTMKAARAMRDAAKDGKTCIDCHKGIAHQMPDVSAGHRRQLADLTAQAAGLAVKPGDRLYTLAALPFHLDHPATGEAAGEIAPAAAVEVLSVEGDAVKLALSGWRRESSPTVLYDRPGKRITLATLAEPSVERLEIGRAVADEDSGQDWSEARLVVWTRSGALLGDRQLLWRYAARINDDNCSLCHDVHAPGALAANDWIGNISTMKRLTPLTEDEARILLVYLQHNAKDLRP